MINIISVETPIIVPSNKVYIIGGDPVTLTCKTRLDETENATYYWKLNSTSLYVFLYT